MLGWVCSAPLMPSASSKADAHCPLSTAPSPQKADKTAAMRHVAVYILNAANRWAYRSISTT